MPIAREIACMECGGPAFLLQPIDEEALIEPGDVLAYRCRDCAERWDVVVDAADLTDDV